MWSAIRAVLTVLGWGATAVSRRHELRQRLLQPRYLLLVAGYVVGVVLMFVGYRGDAEQIGISGMSLFCLCHGLGSFWAIGEEQTCFLRGARLTIGIVFFGVGLVGLFYIIGSLWVNGRSS